MKVIKEDTLKLLKVIEKEYDQLQDEENIIEPKEGKGRVELDGEDNSNGTNREEEKESNGESDTSRDNLEENIREEEEQSIIGNPYLQNKQPRYN